MVLCFKEVEVDASHKTFGVVGVRVSPSVVHILLSHIETEVDDLEWVVTRMKAESVAELPNKVAGLATFSVCSLFYEKLSGLLPVFSVHFTFRLLY